MKLKEKSSHILAVIKSKVDEAITGNLKLHLGNNIKKKIIAAAVVTEAEAAEMTIKMIASKEAGATAEVLKEEKVTLRTNTSKSQQIKPKSHLLKSLMWN